MSKRKKLKRISGLALVVAIGTFIGTGDVYMWALNKVMID